MATEALGVVMLGRDHDRYGIVDAVSVSPQVATAVSVGADQNSPSLQFKGSAEVPNEDAVLAVDAASIVVLAVADAHFGHESSHQLIEGIATQLERGAPVSLPDVYDILALIGASTASETESESTLVIAVLDREQGRGFGISYGDSTAALVGPSSGLRQLNVHDSNYVRADSFLTPTPGARFDFQVAPDDLLMLYTDGIDECHYRNSATSVQPGHIERLVGQFGADPEQLVTQMVEVALAGVDGNPGGQDNIAVAAASVAWD